MHGPPIVIETLGDLVAYGYGLNAMCGRCRYRRDLDMAALIAKLGPEFCHIGKAVDRHLVCSPPWTGSNGSRPAAHVARTEENRRLRE
jgi:hypothetical protein